MNSRFVAVLALKILAVYVIIQALKNLPMFVSTTQMLLQLREPVPNGSFSIDGGSLFLFGGITPFLLLVVIGILIWLYAEKISTYILFKQQVEDINTKEAEEQFLKELQVVLFSLVGLLVLVHSLPQVFTIIPNLVLLSDEYTRTNYPGQMHTIYWSIGLIIQIGIGFYLFFGSKGLVGLVKKIRDFD
ncbi:hypothetical protein RJD24_09150 [Bacillaceae bacterium IKA-2]|nr:hypothetical protein RJD24_09150 [Bacillaceae bacterium IKA-2]